MVAGCSASEPRPRSFTVAAGDGLTGAVVAQLPSGTGTRTLRFASNGSGVEDVFEWQCSPTVPQCDVSGHR
jgi:hypothetical protein